MEIIGIIFCIFIVVMVFIFFFSIGMLFESTYKKPLTIKDRCIGKVEIDKSLKYVIYFDGNIAIGYSTVWYSLSGRRYGTMDESSLSDIYRSATIKEASGHVYPILSVANLNRRQQLLERLK